MKPFKGIIHNWKFLNGRIVGLILAAPDSEDVGKNIFTSEVQEIYLMHGVRFATTKNSLYALA